MTFGEAKDVCQRDGGILAIIDAQDTNHLVVKKIRFDILLFFSSFYDMKLVHGAPACAQILFSSYRLVVLF